MTGPHETRWRSGGPLDLGLATARFGRWGADPVNVVDGGAFWRAVWGPGGPVPYRAHQERDGTVVVAARDGDEAALALADLRHRLAEDLPRAPLEALAARDPVVARAYERRRGYRVPLTPDPFESIVASITAQQVNLRWATTTRARLVERFGTTVRLLGRDLRVFPRPGDLAGADPAELRALQLNWTKARAIVGLAARAADSALDGLYALDDAAVAARLLPLFGVGRWTVDWTLARCLARPHAVAPTDLGVRKAIGTIYLGLDDPATPEEVTEVTEPWGTAANWAVHLLLEELASATS